MDHVFQYLESLEGSQSVNSCNFRSAALTIMLGSYWDPRYEHIGTHKCLKRTLEIGSTRENSVTIYTELCNRNIKGRRLARATIML